MDSEPDHLRPEYSPLTWYGQAEFMARVSGRLLKSWELEDPPQFLVRTEASVVCLPSFTPEWALRLMSDRGASSLLLSEADSMICVSDSSVVSVQHTYVSVSGEAAEAISAVWRQMLKRVR